MKTRRLMLGLAAVGLTVAFYGPTRTHGQPAGLPGAPKARPAPAPPGTPKGRPAPADANGQLTGITGCVDCHEGSTKNRAPGFVKRFGSDQFIRLNESATWTEKDVHSIARVTLAGPLGSQMASRLGWKVTEDARCLTCHSVDRDPTTPLNAKTPADFATAADGVNCTACHGLGRNWQVDHYVDPENAADPPPWRSGAPAYKYSRGMTDLRDPATKARLCASCHVGNPNEGKEVTHEMYAAGHPPLPPFELATFMEDEPKHWGYPTDERLKFFAGLAAAPPQERWAKFRFHPAAEESYLARHTAAGAVASLGAEMRLVAAAADGAEGGVDYARFDCYSCHHDLKYPSDRQRRQPDGPPGRPPLKGWVAALPGVVAEHALGLDDAELKRLAGEYGAKWAAVRTAAVSQPFGEPKALAASASALADWCDSFLDRQSKVDTPVYIPSQADRLLDMIAAAAVSERWAADPEAAMHLSWAYVTLRGDRARPVPDDKRAALAAAVVARVRHPDDAAGSDHKPKPVAAYLRQRMERFAAHDPGTFTRALRAAAGLPEK